MKNNQILDDELIPNKSYRDSMAKALDTVETSLKVLLVVLFATLALVACIRFCLLNLDTARFILDIIFYVFILSFALFAYSMYLFHQSNNQ